MTTTTYTSAQAHEKLDALGYLGDRNDSVEKRLELQAKEHAEALKERNAAIARFASLESEYKRLYAELNAKKTAADIQRKYPPAAATASSASPDGDATERVTFESGAVRSTSFSDVRYDLIPDGPKRRLAQRYALGAKKYGDHNWQKGFPIGVILNHLEAHLEDWKRDGSVKDDNLAALAWGVFTLMWYEENKPELIAKWRTEPEVQPEDRSVMRGVKFEDSSGLEIMESIAAELEKAFGGKVQIRQIDLADIFPQKIKPDTDPSEDRSEYQQNGETEAKKNDDCDCPACQFRRKIEKLSSSLAVEDEEDDIRMKTAQYLKSLRSNPDEEFGPDVIREDIENFKTVRKFLRDLIKQGERRLAKLEKEE